MNSSLLLAFLAFGAACSSLWAWMLATASEQRRALEAVPAERGPEPRPGSPGQPPQGR
ncbi:MAG: hypothetical protein VKK62_01715 [Synechococcaceae cyanobacterium]|nr:hypothetical protein [Synechococcaceae cyanobacterium]